jgi:hypothetical protein
MTESPSKTARRNALDRFDRYGSERTFQLVYLLLLGLMMLFVWGFVQLADFSNRVHVLIFLSVLATYIPMVIGTALLWGHVNRSTRLVLRAIDLATRKVPEDKDSASRPPGAEPDPKSRLWL